MVRTLNRQIGGILHTCVIDKDLKFFNHERGIAKLRSLKTERWGFQKARKLNFNPNIPRQKCNFNAISFNFHAIFMMNYQVELSN